MSTRTLVVCVGNALAGDDAAGCLVFEALRGTSLDPGSRIELLALAGIELVEQLAGEDKLIVVDAVHLGATIGTIHLVDWRELPAARPAISAHGVGLREALEVTRLLYPERLPREALLLGIEGRNFDELGTAASAEVVDAVTRAAQILRAQIGCEP